MSDAAHDDSPRSYLVGHGLMFLAERPACYHCHHFNLFLDQTVDDALGPERSTELRFHAARAASFELIRAVAEASGATTSEEILELAPGLFSAMGHGVLEVQGGGAETTMRGRHLHYGHAWSEKYGQVVQRSLPADAFAAGFAAAALDVAAGHAEPRFYAKEDACIVTRAPHCHFSIAPESDAHAHPGSLTKDLSRQRVQTPLEGMHEDMIRTIAAGLRDFTAGVAGDSRGLVQAFGVYVTAHLTDYYNAITYGALDEISASSPQSVPMLEDLFRESAHVCVFNTFGGILLSPEWEGMVAPLSGDPEEIALGCMAIARALGFGQWVLHDFEPGKRMVMRTPSSYESVYTLERRGIADHPIEYFSQGATLAIAQLAHRVPWTERPMLDRKLYSSLFRGRSPWKVEQTRSLASGHDYSELVAVHV